MPSITVSGSPDAVSPPEVALPPLVPLPLSEAVADGASCAADAEGAVSSGAPVFVSCAPVSEAASESLPWQAVRSRVLAKAAATRTAVLVRRAEAMVTLPGRGRPGRDVSTGCR